MPERDKQVDDMARTLAGAEHRPLGTRLGAIPGGVSDDSWDAARSMADRLYVDLVERIDFTRILIEARKRHMTLHEGQVRAEVAFDIGTARFTDFCGDCVTEVMLATATNPPWSEESQSPRYLVYVDPHAPDYSVPLVAPLVGLIRDDASDVDNDIDDIDDRDWQPEDGEF